MTENVLENIPRSRPGLERHCKCYTHVYSRLYSTKKRLRNAERERKHTLRLLTILLHKKVLILQDNFH